MSVSKVCVHDNLRNTRRNFILRYNQKLSKSSKAEFEDDQN